MVGVRHSRVRLPSQNRADDAVAKRVAEMFANTLGLDRVGVDEHFFELGGESLLAAEVVTRIEQAMHVRLPVNAVFSSPTPCALAAAIAASDHGDSGETPIPRAPRHEVTKPLSNPSEAQKQRR